MYSKYHLLFVNLETLQNDFIFSDAQQYDDDSNKVFGDEVRYLLRYLQQRVLHLHYAQSEL